MYYYIMNKEKPNKILLADTDLERLKNTLPFFPDYAEYDILETEEEIEEGYFKGSDDWRIWKAGEIRSVRNSYLETYIDPLVSNPLRYADLTDREKTALVNYRRYLLDIPESEAFPDIHVMTYDEWAEETDELEIEV